MRKLVLKMSMSMDGFVVGPDPESDWMFRGSSPDSATWVLEILSGAGTHAVGRHLFESWAAYWPTSDNPMAAPVNDIPKVVFTRQADYDPAALSDPTASSPSATPGPPVTSSGGPSNWATSRVANGDLSAEIDRLKREPGGYILAQGGVSFCRSLVQRDLVDEYRFAVLPVALGSGEGLFTGLDRELDFELVSSTAFTGGALGTVYRPASSQRQRSERQR